MVGLGIFVVYYLELLLLVVTFDVHWCFGGLLRVLRLPDFPRLWCPAFSLRGGGVPEGKGQLQDYIGISTALVYVY